MNHLSETRRGFQDCPGQGVNQASFGLLHLIYFQMQCPRSLSCCVPVSKLFRLEKLCRFFLDGGRCSFPERNPSPRPECRKGGPGVVRRPQRRLLFGARKTLTAQLNIQVQSHRRWGPEEVATARVSQRFTSWRCSAKVRIVAISLVVEC